MPTPGTDVTQLLLNWKTGDREALEQLTPMLYDELRRVADSYMRRQSTGHTLQATALVHEAYIKLADQTRLEARDRTHFFAIAAQVMRRILVDHYRARSASKRGGGSAGIPLDEGLVIGQERGSDIVALDDALEALNRFDPRKARLVELRFFGGLSIEEAAAATDTSVATVGRELRAAQAWLRREMSAAGTE